MNAPTPDSIPIAQPKGAARRTRNQHQTIFTWSFGFMLTAAVPTMLATQRAAKLIGGLTFEEGVDPYWITKFLIHHAFNYAAGVTLVGLIVAVGFALKRRWLIAAAASSVASLGLVYLANLAILGVVYAFEPV